MAAFIFPTYAKKIPLPKAVFVNSGGGSTSTSFTQGSGSITGRVLESGLPVSRRVMLFERKSGQLVASTKSAADGTYSFGKTDERALYFVVALDEHNDGVQYNLKGQDLISGNHDKLNP